MFKQKRNIRKVFFFKINFVAVSTGGDDSEFTHRGKTGIIFKYLCSKEERGRKSIDQINI